MAKEDQRENKSQSVSLLNFGVRVKAYFNIDRLETKIKEISMANQNNGKITRTQSELKVKTNKLT